MSNAAEPSGSSQSRHGSATSRSLLARARGNDQAAWEQLVRLYAPFVLHWCRRDGLRDEDAADVLQEVFRAVAGHVRGFRRERPGDTFRGWLRTITRHKVYDHLRRRGREPEGEGGTDAQMRWAMIPAQEPPEPGSDPLEATAEVVLCQTALESIRGEFEPHTWQAFWQTAVEGRLAGDVAIDLAMTAGAVRVAKSRVLRRLREELGDLG